MHAVQTEPVVAISEHNSLLHLWPRLSRRFSTQEEMKSCMRESCGALIPAHLHKATLKRATASAGVCQGWCLTLPSRTRSFTELTVAGLELCEAMLCEAGSCGIECWNSGGTSVGARAVALPLACACCISCVCARMHTPLSPERGTRFLSCLRVD